MQKCWVPLLFAIGAFTYALASLANLPSQGRSRSSQALELALKADRGVYKMSDSLHLETRLTNVGKEDVYIWEWDLCWNPARGLSMRIVDAQGKDVQGRVLCDCVPPPPREGDVYQFFKLGPGRFYGRDEDFKISEVVNGPGTYEIGATFNSFSSTDWTTKYLRKDPIAKLPLWTMEQPALTSNRIHINVEP